jgi:vacuolar-type H+-ATPase subunit I/STV1
MYSQEPRANTTTFRYSVTVHKILTYEVPGNSIADKIEYICLDYREKKDQREEQIKELDKQIEQKRKQLDKIKDKVLKFDSVDYNLEQLLKSIDKCNT